MSTVVGQAPRAAPAPTRPRHPSGCAFTWQSSARGCSRQPEPLQHGNCAPFTERSSVLHAASRISAQLAGELHLAFPSGTSSSCTCIRPPSREFLLLLSLLQPTSPCSLSSRRSGTFPGTRPAVKAGLCTESGDINEPRHGAQISWGAKIQQG